MAIIDTLKKDDRAQGMLRNLNALLVFHDGKAGIAFLSGFVLFAIGDISISIKALILLWIIDFVLGFCMALKKEGIDTKKMIIGIRKFLLYFLAISAGNLLDLIFFGNELDIAGHKIGFRWVVILYIAAHQALELLRKLRELGVPLPGSIDKVLIENNKRIDQLGMSEAEKIVADVPPPEPGI